MDKFYHSSKLDESCARAASTVIKRFYRAHPGAKAKQGQYLCSNSRIDCGEWHTGSGSPPYKACGPMISWM